MSGKQLILNYLQSHVGEWCNTIDISQTCKPGAINWAIRSRMSEIKSDGYWINSRIGKNRQAEYRLELLPPLTSASSCDKLADVDHTPRPQGTSKNTVMKEEGNQLRLF